MNPKIFISSIVISSLFFVSCKKELEPQESTPTSELVKLGLVKDTAKVKSVVEAPQPQTNPNTVLSETKGLNPAHGQPGHRCDIAVGAPLNSAPTQGQTATAQPTQTVQVNPNQKNMVTTTTTVAALVKVAKGMNPSHGQPGHRCDIPVGAPLNSPVAKAAATQSGNTSQSFTVAPPTKVAKGMNPAHGQPGHRCDIPVGAPLNSPVAKPVAATPTQSGSTSQTFTVTPPAGTQNAVPALLSTEAPKVAEGMNPAHGQPGHRCDIAVGQPLPKS